MKNIISISSMILISITCFGQSIKTTNMGLAGEMIYNKSYAENKLYVLINDTVFVKDHKAIVDSLIIKYQSLQFATDQVVMAMTSILKSKTKPWKYKRIDKALFENSLANLNSYSNPRLDGIRKGLKVTSILFEDLSNYINNITRPALLGSPGFSVMAIAPSDALDMFGSLYDIFKDSRERAANKAGALSDLIQEFRLNPITDLMKKSASKADEDATASETR